MTQNDFDKLAHFPDCSCLENIQHPSHARPGIHVFPDKLFVVTTLFNPLRFRNRYYNYHAFESMCEKAGAILYTVEIAFGDRHFEITDPSNPRHLQLRARDNQEIWLKENSLNLLINRLPPEAKYIAWLDSDISFARPDWAQETLHLLQHYSFLQMFSHAQDIDINYSPGTITPGFVYGKLIEEDNDFPNTINKQPNKQLQKAKIKADLTKAGGEFGECLEKCLEESIDECLKECSYYGIELKGKEKGWKYRHPGFAHAARRSALDKVGGLIDWGILGSSDWIMINALFGQVNRTLNEGYSDNFKKLCYIWQDRALKEIRKNVGFLPGLITHMYHGDKKSRNYDNRWRLLVQTKFDPLTDIKRDTTGLWQLNDDGSERYVALRDGLRKYGRLRQEDSNMGQIVP
jgi:hypothetical protein